MTSLLGLKKYKLNERITFFIPTVGQMRDAELRSDIEKTMNMFIVTPSNYLVELYDEGIDFRKVREYDLFLQLLLSNFILPRSKGRPYPDSTKVFDGVDLSECSVAEKDGERIVVDKNGGFVMGRIQYMQLSSGFCEILNVKKYRRKPANETAYEYIVETERDKRKASKRNNASSNVLDEYIVALVCDSGFPYDFKTVNELTIYDFYCCIKQIVKRTNYNNLMMGLYGGFGTVDKKKIKAQDLNFLSFRS